ncbi:uncharacterized protein LOC129778314 [Toxorhynchites rutilus septentrionalis]|uniref:uncharacterized protein LOC129778314 n=1 Tax=Toxorhynchites rutilus septentrionalis TaxID=329112 RepID=UPI00247AA0F1|nr:uncharacterized protein LOC129778314 [Toxorhynchites rutilus septentrionalis]
MFKVTICALVAFALVNLVVAFDGEQHTYGNDPYRRSVFSGSDEADFYLNSDKEDEAIDLGKFHHPQNARKMFVVKRLSPTSAPIVKRANYATAENSWSKYLNKISDMQIMPSSEEVDPEASSLNMKVDDSAEPSYGYLEEVNTVKMNDSYSNDMAQKWFPILMKNANDETPQSNARKDIKPNDKSTFRPWKFEDLDESMRKFVDWMLTTLHQARYKFNETETLEATPSVKQKRFDRSEEREKDNRENCRPCVINIFNSSHIGYLVLSPNSNSSEDCVKLCSNSDIFGKSGQIDANSLKNLGHIVDVALHATTPSATFDLDNSLVRWDRSNVLGVTKTIPSITSTMPSGHIVSTTTPKVPPTRLSAKQTSTVRNKPASKSLFNAQPSPLYPSQFYPYQPPYNPGWKASSNQSPKYREPGYEPKKSLYSNPGKFEDHVGYDPYRDLPYDIPSAEIIANSQEFEYPSPYQQNRESKIPPSDLKSQSSKPNRANDYTMAQADDGVRLIIDPPPPSEYQSQETRQNAKLRDTLSKVGLSFKSDRPPKTKQSNSPVYNQFTMSQPARSQRDQVKSKAYGGTHGVPSKKTMGRKAAPSTFLF